MSIVANERSGAEPNTALKALYLTDYYLPHFISTTEEVRHLSERFSSSESFRRIRTSIVYSSKTYFLERLLLLLVSFSSSFSSQNQMK